MNKNQEKKNMSNYQDYPVIKGSFDSVLNQANFSVDNRHYQVPCSDEESYHQLKQIVQDTAGTVYKYGCNVGYVQAMNQCTSSSSDSPILKAALSIQI